MNRVDFLICYDISDKKRLRKIAKFLESISIRIQKSIFFYPQATSYDIKIMIKALKEILDNKEDDIRIYQIDINRSLNINKGLSLKKPNILA